MTNAFHAITAEEAAYVRSRDEARYLSIEQAVRAIRTLMPACRTSDHELEEMLAAACILHHVPVAFDVATADSSETKFSS
ncbi:hypothetical protein FJW07_30665 [Mesorhizobium sp. B3-1-9]|uniref:hypothetical protein n=1 Tax=Mesorhizobium sp. B3-1-9 TaxID=2589892 RepID=UPI00112CDF31|nr:hypothetical protein [Mesorhizobium sp. B3-1-9]TPI28790.1 hypothetical protein FJW07_30665 [Mesorhizobium sp. B3-1-9]